MTVNGVDDTFVGRAADVSVDQTISILANIYLLRSGDATDIRIFLIMLQYFQRIDARLTRNETLGSYETSSSQRIKRLYIWQL